MARNDNDVVVVSMGLVSSSGDGYRTWRMMVEGRTGAIRSGSPVASMPLNIVAPVGRRFYSEQEEAFLRKTDHRFEKRLSLPSKMAIVAAYRASQCIPHDIFKDLGMHRIAVVMGVAKGGSVQDEHIIRSISDHLDDPSGAWSFPVAEGIESLPNMQASRIAQAFGFHGPVHTDAGACAAGIHAAWSAYSLLEKGMADVVFCGGSESLNEGFSVRAGFHKLGVSTTLKNGMDVGSTPSAFDVNSSGFVLGAGAAILVMMRSSTAQRYKLKPLGVVTGFGFTNDAYNCATPDPTGQYLAKAIESALVQARLRPIDVGVIVSHGAGTIAGDKAEVAAIRSVFGLGRNSPWITANKPNVGHTMGPAAAISLCEALHILREGRIPPILNLVHPIDSSLRFVKGSPLHAKVTNVLILAAGLGGGNGAIIVQKHGVVR